MNIAITKKIANSVIGQGRNGYFYSTAANADADNLSFHTSKLHSTFDKKERLYEHDNLDHSESIATGIVEFSDVDAKAYLLSPEDLKAAMKNSVEIIEIILTKGYFAVDIKKIQCAELEIREVRHWCCEESLILEIDKVVSDLAIQKYNTILYGEIAAARDVLARGNSQNTANIVRRTIRKLSEAISPAMSSVLIKEAVTINDTLESLLHSFD